MQISLFFIFGFLNQFQCQVLDLDNSFLSARENKAYLVEFYAPWCGHCKHLEPIYHQAYLELKGVSVVVAKVDATVHRDVSEAFDIRGYPTIKFIQGDRIFTYHGERSKEGIAEFAKRAIGPVVRPINRLIEFEDVKRKHTNDVFFLSIGIQSDNDFFQAYEKAADNFAVQSYFYHIDASILNETLDLEFMPTSLVFKDGASIEYTPDEHIPINESLALWVNAERFETFPVVGGATLNELALVGKLIVVFVFDDVEGDSLQKEYYDLAKNVAFNKRDFLKKYQFVQLDPSIASNIVIKSVAAPFVFVLDPLVYEYYYLDLSENLTKEHLLNSLEDVMSGKIEAHGGTNFMARFHRLMYDLYIAIIGLYHDSPVFAMIMFGVPMGVAAIVGYLLCCLEMNGEVGADDFEEYSDEGEQEEILFPEDETEELATPEDKKDQ